MTAPAKRVLVVGAGLADLAYAVYLRKSGAGPLVSEPSEEIGGQVRTEGFLLDRGLLVYLDAYPKAGKLLVTRSSFDLRPLKPNALVYLEEYLRRADCDHLGHVPAVSFFRRRGLRWGNTATDRPDCEGP
jgi:phytoene dehydrogenase-like protein